MGATESKPRLSAEGRVADLLPLKLNCMSNSTYIRMEYVPAELPTSTVDTKAADSLSYIPDAGRKDEASQICQQYHFVAQWRTEREGFEDLPESEEEFHERPWLYSRTRLFQTHVMLLTDLERMTHYHLRVGAYSKTGTRIFAGADCSVSWDYEFPCSTREATPEQEAFRPPAPHVIPSHFQAPQLDPRMRRADAGAPAPEEALVVQLVFSVLENGSPALRAPCYFEVASQYGQDAWRSVRVPFCKAAALEQRPDHVSQHVRLFTHEAWLPHVVREEHTGSLALRCRAVYMDEYLVSEWSNVREVDSLLDELSFAPGEECRSEREAGRRRVRAALAQAPGPGAPWALPRFQWPVVQAASEHRRTIFAQILKAARDKQMTQINVLMLGHQGAGKSTSVDLLLSSLDPELRQTNTSIVAKNEKSMTTQLSKRLLGRDKLPKSEDKIEYPDVALWDCFGYNESLAFEDPKDFPFEDLVQGHLRAGFELDADKQHGYLSTKPHKLADYRNSPKDSDRMHACIFCVLGHRSIEEYTNSYYIRQRRAQVMLSEQGIDGIVMLTKLDLCDPDFFKKYGALGLPFSHESFSRIDHLRNSDDMAWPGSAFPVAVDRSKFSNLGQIDYYTAYLAIRAFCAALGKAVDRYQPRSHPRRIVSQLRVPNSTLRDEEGPIGRQDGDYSSDDD